MSWMHVLETSLVIMLGIGVLLAIVLVALLVQQGIALRRRRSSPGDD